MLTLEYIENGESNVFSVAGPVLVEGNLPLHLLVPALPTLEDYVRHVAESPANLMSLGRINQGLRILDEVEVSPEDVLSIINRDTYDQFNSDQSWYVEVAPEQIQDYRQDIWHEDAPKTGKRLVRSCGPNKIWVANNAVTGGGYCRKLPTTTGASAEASGSRFTKRQKIAAVAISGLALAGAGAAGGLAATAAVRAKSPRDKPRSPTSKSSRARTASVASLASPPKDKMPSAAASRAKAPPQPEAKGTPKPEPKTEVAAQAAAPAPFKATEQPDPWQGPPTASPASGASGASAPRGPSAISPAPVLLAPAPFKAATPPSPWDQLPESGLASPSNQVSTVETTQTRLLQAGYTTPPDPWSTPATEYENLRPKRDRGANQVPEVDDFGSEADFQRRQSRIASAKALQKDKGIGLYQKLAGELEGYKDNSGKTRELDRQIYEAEAAYGQLYNPLTEPYFQKYGPTVRSAGERLSQLQEDAKQLSQTLPRGKREELVNRSESLLRDIDLQMKDLSGEYPTEGIQDAYDQLAQTRGMVLGVNKAYGDLEAYEQRLEQQQERLAKLPTNRSQLTTEEEVEYRKMLKDHTAHKEVGSVVLKTTHNQATAIREFEQGMEEQMEFEQAYAQNKQMAQNSAIMGVPRFVPKLRRASEALDMMSSKQGEQWVIANEGELNDAAIELRSQFGGKLDTVEQRAAFREYAIEQLADKVTTESSQIEALIKKPKKVYRQAFTDAQKKVDAWKSRLWKQTNGKLNQQTNQAKKVVQRNAEIVSSSIEGVTRESEKADADIVVQEIDNRQKAVQKAMGQGLDYARKVRQRISDEERSRLQTEYLVDGQYEREKPLLRQLRNIRKKAKAAKKKIQNPKTRKTERILTSSDVAQQELSNKIVTLSQQMVASHGQMAEATKKLNKVQRSNTRTNAPTNIPTDRLEAERRGHQLEIRKINARRRSLTRELEMLQEQARQDGYTDEDFPILGVADVTRFDVDDMAGVDGYDLLLETSQMYYDPDIPFHTDVGDEVDLADYIAEVYAKK